MTTSKKVQPGRLVSENYGLYLYELSSDFQPYVSGLVEGFETVHVAFSSSNVAVRVVRGVELISPDCPGASALHQVILEREVFDRLIASYQAYKRAKAKWDAEKNSASVPDDYDPFIDSDELP